MKSGEKKGKGKIVKTVLLVIAVFFLLQWLFIGWRYNYGPFKTLSQVRLGGLSGNAEEYSFDKIMPMENSPLQGKTVLFLGSSVTNGAAALHDSIPEYFAARMGCTAIKEAVDGTTLVDDKSNSYISRMKANISANAEIKLVVCQLSTNDASQEKPLGEISASQNLDDFDTGTITGAMEYIIAYAKDTWGCPVVFYTNARYDSENYAAMVERVHELEEKWGIGVLDLWSSEDFNNITAEQRALYMYDTIHPLRAGYRDWWGPELEKQLCAYLGA